MEWIKSCSEKPKDNSVVWAFFKSLGVVKSIYSGGMWFVAFTRVSTPTHWMPHKPEPPKEDE